MDHAENATLRVPGATLYYQLRGSGPYLLMLQGGDGDANGSDGIGRYLADHFTLVTYDRRGLSRSKIDDPSEPIRLETHSDDAHHLLAALTTEPAFVSGGSLGALVGLDLVSRYPEQVRLLVAHEPPAPELLPEPERNRAIQSQEDMEEAFKKEGLAAAIPRMMALAKMDFADREPDVELPRPNLERAPNTTFFLEHDAGAVRCYRLNLPALIAARKLIAPAAGASAQDVWAHHCAVALAERLRRDWVEFPGGHNGYIFHPREFAARLIESFHKLDADVRFP